MNFAFSSDYVKIQKTGGSYKNFFLLIWQGIIKNTKPSARKHAEG